MEDADKRQQTLIVLWAAMLMSIVMLFVVSLVAAPVIIQPPPFANLVSFAGAALGTFLVGFSFVIKKRLLKRSVDQQDVLLVQKALIIGCALCEACAIIGVVEAFVIGGIDRYLLFFLAAAGFAFHFPRRLNLQSASYKSGINQGF